MDQPRFSNADRPPIELSLHYTCATLVNSARKVGSNRIEIPKGSLVPFLPKYAALGLSVGLPVGLLLPSFDDGAKHLGEFVAYDPTTEQYLIDYEDGETEWTKFPDDAIEIRMPRPMKSDVTSAHPSPQPSTLGDGGPLRNAPRVSATTLGSQSQPAMQTVVASPGKILPHCSHTLLKDPLKVELGAHLAAFEGLRLGRKALCACCKHIVDPQLSALGDSVPLSPGTARCPPLMHPPHR